MLIIEDLVFIGQSSLHVVDVLRNVSLDVLGVCAMFSYELPLTKIAFTKANVELHTIGNFAALIDVADELSMLQP